MARWRAPTFFWRLMGGTAGCGIPSKRTQKAQEANVADNADIQTQKPDTDNNTTDVNVAAPHDASVADAPANEGAPVADADASQAEGGTSDGDAGSATAAENAGSATDAAPAPKPVEPAAAAPADATATDAVGDLGKSDTSSTENTATAISPTEELSSGSASEGAITDPLAAPNVLPPLDVPAAPAAEESPAPSTDAPATTVDSAADTTSSNPVEPGITADPAKSDTTGEDHPQLETGTQPAADLPAPAPADAEPAKTEDAPKDEQQGPGVDATTPPAGSTEDQPAAQDDNKSSQAADATFPVVHRIPDQHPRPSDGPVVDPRTGEPVADELQPNKANTSGGADAGDSEVAQDRANGYSAGSELKDELESMLKTIRGALKHEADLGRQLMHKVESKIHNLLSGLKKGN